METKLFLLCLLIRQIMPIVLNNGRYEDLYIVIQDDNVENEFLLKRIQEVFTAASERLFTATKNHMYFGQIKVIIPKTWSSKTEFKRMAVPSFIEQYIIVEGTSSGGPRVYGLTECGSGGSKMYLNSHTFLLIEGLTNWGKHDNVIVHEWGHLRFGLYDEYPVTKQKYKKFYQADGKWNPVRCTGTIHGVIGTGFDCKGRSDCDTSDASKDMDSNCRFCPNIDQEADASLMGYAYIDALSMFCDKNDPKVPEKQRHNLQAPNKHNILCNCLSAWEVMRKHKDFQNTRALPSSTDTTPIFEFIQETSKYRVLVLDVSGSMEGNKLETLTLTSKYVIQDLIPLGSWLGIVTFSNEATVVKYLTEIKSQDERDDLKAALPRYADGSTCIGCGIEEAIRILKQKFSDAENSEIFLVSDGENNKGDIERSKQVAVSENVIVHTVSVTQEADVLLAEISEETGGYHFTYLEIGSTSFIALFATLITEDITSTLSHAAMLASERINATSTILQIGFSIENGLGNNTSVTVISQSLGLFLFLTGPSNYSEALNTTKQISTLLIPGIAQAGDYVLTINMVEGGHAIEYLVKSTPTSYDILQVSAKLSASKIDFSSGKLPVIFAEITKGHSPVLNATVTARVETDDGSRECDISLYDNGMDPDGSANDGMYSGYILPSCLYAGRVSTKVSARGRRGETMIMRGIAGSQPTYSDEEPEVYKDAFQRVAVLNDLYIENYVEDHQNDTVSPGRITDVNIHHIVKQETSSGENRNFTISWRATGDDKNVGQASAYMLRISDDFETLLNNFDSAKLLDMKNVALRPKTSGEKEALKIVVHAKEPYTGTTFFAIKAVDEAGNVGDVSNILSIVVAEGYRAYGERGSLEIAKDINVTIAKEDDMTTYIIIGSVGGSFFLLLCLTIICFCRKRKSKNTENPDLHLGRV